MTKHVHIHIHSQDNAAWSEAKHPRAPDGKFGTGGAAKPGHGGKGPGALLDPGFKKTMDPGQRALSTGPNKAEPDSGGFGSMSIGQRQTISQVASRKDPSQFSTGEKGAAFLTIGALKAVGIEAKAITGGEGNIGIKVVKREGKAFVDITKADLTKAMAHK